MPHFFTMTTMYEAGLYYVTENWYGYACKRDESELCRRKGKEDHDQISLTPIYLERPCSSLTGLL
jgi:hypothetical protein